MPLIKTIRIHAERLGCELIELNVQADHVHSLVKIPPEGFGVEVDEGGEGTHGFTGLQTIFLFEAEALLG